jgi:hypothetical protein
LDTLAKWAIVPVAAGLVIAVLVATWWLVGDQSTVPLSADPDYTFREFDIEPGTQRAAGIGSILLAVIALLALVWAAHRRHLDPRWWSVFVPLLVASFIVGCGWRVMTAGVIGANIGAGLAIMFGGPAVAVLLVWALGYSIHLLRRRATQRSVR